MAGKLKPLEGARLVTPGKYPDGDGLYLVVAGATSRNWSYRYWINGKKRWHGLGSLNGVSLRDARLKRDAARQQVRAGVDIVQAKRSAREEAKSVSEAEAAPTFMRGKIHRGKLGKVEQKAPRPMALIAKLLRLPGDRSSYDWRNQAQPHFSAASADLGQKSRDSKSSARAH
jgi:Arm DNA-binding domain